LLIFTKMILTEAKTENDARQVLVEKLITINNVLNGIPIEGGHDNLKDQEIFYNHMVNYIHKEFPKLDTRPYETIANRLLQGKLK